MPDLPNNFKNSVDELERLILSVFGDYFKALWQKWICQDICSRYVRRDYERDE